ncbi:iron ABC transporter permease [Sulfitobacter sp. SK012]|uniref:ABC transporter permease n=1 Tax=Sulfitobacter sp. SK012 TaxID=1389005 RepID=UPI000E0C433F|nr:iron ABC transporter permease [Sulfitobacter sp. SK012]AXI45624.1 iron ABC transporter permease [Sulfitobacter sp. SK012]
MRQATFDKAANPVLTFWIIAGLVGFFVLPWYGIEDFFRFEWFLDGYPLDSDYAPGGFLIAQGEKLWLAPLVLPLLAPIAILKKRKTEPIYAKVLILAGAFGFGWLVLQGFAIGIRGWNFGWASALFGDLGDRQYGMGYGALICASAFLFVFTQGIAARGAINGDVFVVSSIGGVVAIVTAFVFFPIAKMLTAAFITQDGGYSVAVFFSKFFDDRLWGIGCLTGGRCGVAWNSLFLAVCVGFITTVLGLVFALVVTRSGFRFKRGLRALTVLPIITPPFVIGLALILLFGLSGTVTVWVADLFGVQPTRWLYGLPGILIAQTLAFTPIAFLVLIGVVEGVSPSMEEAAQTLRASKWQVFKTVSLPLMRPGLANAFLLGFIESMADFGNPLVLGGNFDVLSTEIFFAIVGAQYDQGQAAVLAMVLLFFTLGAFYAQRFWLGNKSYTTVSGKGDSGVHPHMPNALSIPVLLIAMIWAAFTIVVYLMIFYGSVVELWGVNNTLTFKHYVTAFSLRFDEEGIRWTGAAWDSFWTTLKIAAIAAPLTAVVGLVTAYLLTRQTFAGKNAFEFGTMLSFAIPGTVIGVSYILAFNVPPIEITGTGIILVVSFIFRNMPVGVRAGIASMSQLDKSLDESSLTLGANSWQTFRRIILPLLRPAILAALVYSFVRAMTAISAVIFLVSAEYNMATSYIIGRVENNDYGLAIAYSTTLIFVMLLVVLTMQLVVGRTKVGRRMSQSRTNV